MFENQPKGLWALALANTGERFGYYTMLAVRSEERRVGKECDLAC